MKPFKNVLLVDDDESYNYLNIMTLEEFGFAEEINETLDGEEALKLIQDQGCPDLILLDIRMPRMDGFEFLEEIERLNLCPNTKVVMLTSSKRPEDQEKAKQYKKVISFHVKPLEEESLNKIIQLAGSSG